jgi:hypothetical protein
MMPTARPTKQKKDKLLQFTKIKNFFSPEGTTENDNSTTEWEKIFIKLFSDRGLESRT